MIALAAHIEYLLLNRQSVIVPALGEFSTQNTPSRWIACENLFLPPIRNVHFDASKQQDPEEIFLQSLAEINHFGPAESLEYCERLVADFHKQLITEGTVDFGSIGVFTLEDDAEIVMASCECGVTTPNYYGLDALHFIPLSQLQDAEQTEAQNITVETAAEVRTTEPAEPLEQKNQPTVLEVESVRQEQDCDENAVISSDSSHIIIRIRKSTLHYTMAVAASILLFFMLQPTVIQQGPSDSKMAAMDMFVQPNMVIVNTSSTTLSTTQEDKTSILETVQSDDSTQDATLADFTTIQNENSNATTVATTSLQTEVANTESKAAPVETQICEPSTKRIDAPTASKKIDAPTTSKSIDVPATSKSIVSPSTVQKTAETPAASKKSSEETAIESQNHTKFSIVLASGVPQANANEYAAKLNKRGIKAIVTMDGKMRRVVVPCGDDQGKAYQQLAELKKQNEDLSAAWMLKK